MAKLNEFLEPAEGAGGVNALPPEIRDQLVNARRTRTHSTSEMLAWLEAEGHELTSAQINGWFQARGIKANSTGRLAGR
jgi:hypothetical protein